MTIENLVLAGGGAKGLAYIGVARALEERDILKTISRFAGNNTGSIIAALLSVGFNSYDVEALMPDTLELLYRDSWRIISKPNSHGWHPSEKFKKYMGEVLDLKTPIPRITFEQIQSICKRELCIMATTKEAKEEKKYDADTNPTMEIREAICKSLYIPAELQPDKKKFEYGDDGFLCKYPIRCFGGKTLGCLTYSDDTNGNPNRINWPRDTKSLSSSDQRKLNFTNENVKCKMNLDSFWNVFIGKDEFSIEDFKEKIETIKNAKKDGLYKARLFAEMMYGLDVDAEIIYKDIKRNGNIVQADMKSFLKEKEKSFQLRQDKGVSKKVDESFNAAKKKIFLEEKDAGSTIDINTGFICASDFLMEGCDRRFLIDEGKRSAEKFLKEPKTVNAPDKPSFTEAEIAEIRGKYL